MLARITSSAVAADLLAGYFDFEVASGEPVAEARLASGAPLEAIAGEGAGGTYYLCGVGSARPVIFATSEGQAGLIAASLAEAVELIVAVPYWQDCLKFSGGGSLDEMRLAAARLEHDLRQDCPQAGQQREPLRRELGLPQTPVEDLLARLHESVARTEPDFVLLGPDGDRYESLFNTFRVSDNPAWR
ncbi:hypothetical protein [Micromonospora sp. HK10]|uniref:hypothetical protein n=1 Tax=Micromonospora sp. HK10 TaxID=1538294 RepID=UPI0006274243|nr:hypothetical protein [Micromonospora sp. HK10]KKJ93843.1 hypothetical protein LQ51_28965 [Micromonospora sp. HK10]